MPQYTVLYNPHAANGRGEENARKLGAVLPNADLEFRDITKVEHYPDFFAEQPICRDVVISGGDGTLNRFLNETEGLVISHRLYYFAGGSGNDFLRDVAGWESGVLIPLEVYRNHLPRVTVGEHTCRFLNGVGYGIDGYCCEEGDRQRAASPKPVNYTAIAIRGLLFHYRPTNAIITVDGEQHTFRKVWLAPTMNGRYYGGGMMPTPAQDRLNDAHTVSTMVFYGSGKLRTLMIFPSIFKGEHIRYRKAVTVLTGREITVEFDRPTPLQIDGETISGVTSYHVSA